MSHLSRKLIAVLMLLWLPLFSASALAASVSMQAQRGACHEAAMEQRHHADAGDHRHHDAAAPAAPDRAASTDQVLSTGQADSSCNACGVCHLACSGYLAVPGLAEPDVPQAVVAATPYAVSFHSVTSVPLVPPPLVRA